MREELKPSATKDSTRAIAAKNSIERSAYYRSAFSDIYPHLAGQVMEKPDTQLPNPYPTPPGASASRASTSAVPKNNKKRDLPVADVDTTPTRTIKRARNSTSTIIDLCSSDDECTKIPFHVILWTAVSSQKIPHFKYVLIPLQNNTDPSTFVLRTSGRSLFTLIEVKHLFAVRGISCRNKADLQVYNTRTSTWAPLSWKAAFGPIAKGQTVLMRDSSVSEMPDFKWMKDMASAR